MLSRLIPKAADTTGGGVDLQAEPVILQRSVVGHDRRYFLLRISRSYSVDPITDGRQIGHEADAVASTAHSRQRLDRLHRYGAPLVVEEPGVFWESPELKLDIRADRPGVRVEHDDRCSTVLLWDLYLPGDGLEGIVQGPAGYRLSLAVGVARVLVCRLDARACEDVMKLVEEHVLPGTREVVRVELTGNMLRY